MVGIEGFTNIDSTYTDDMNIQQGDCAFIFCRTRRAAALSVPRLIHDVQHPPILSDRIVKEKRGSTSIYAFCLLREIHRV